MEKSKVKRAYQKLLQAQAEWKDACRSQDEASIYWQKETGLRLQLAKAEWMSIYTQWKAKDESHTGRDVSGL